MHQLFLPPEKLRESNLVFLGSAIAVIRFNCLVDKRDLLLRGPVSTASLLHVCDHVVCYLFRFVDLS